jgi:hypothetical protein
VPRSYPTCTDVCPGLTGVGRTQTRRSLAVPIATLFACPARWCSRVRRGCRSPGLPRAGAALPRWDQARWAMTLTRRRSPWRARWPSTATGDLVRTRRGPRRWGRGLGGIRRWAASLPGLYGLHSRPGSPYASALKLSTPRPMARGASPNTSTTNLTSSRHHRCPGSRHRGPQMARSCGRPFIGRASGASRQLARMGGQAVARGGLYGMVSGMSDANA